MSRWDGSDDQGLTRWHDTADGGALHAGAAATVTWCEAIRPNCEEKEAGITGVWEKYDKSKVAEDSAEELKYSRRAVKLGKAFQNYRRAILHKLRRACLLKRIFSLWRSVSLPVALCLLDLILTEDDMSYFLQKVASFEAQVANRRLAKAARADPQHMHRGKAMPWLISASLIKLWQVCLAHEHVTLLDKYFGEYSRHLAGRASTRICANLANLWSQEFQERTEALSGHVAKRQRIMTKLEEQPGAKLWTYLFERSHALVAHVYTEKTFSGSRAAGAAGLPEDSVVADSAASTEPAAAAAVPGAPTLAKRLRLEQSQSSPRSESSEEKRARINEEAFQTASDNMLQVQQSDEDHRTAVKIQEDIDADDPIVPMVDVGQRPEDASLAHRRFFMEEEKERLTATERLKAANRAAGDYPSGAGSAGGVPPSSVECVRSAKQTATDVGANRHLQTESAALNAAIASLDCPLPAVANVDAVSKEIDFIFKSPETAQVPLNPPPRNLS